jgi:hypothetical protein
MRECKAWLVGGRRLKLWQAEMVALIEAYARAEGCAYTSGCGRRGWSRALGYDNGGYIVQKAL